MGAHAMPREIARAPALVAVPIRERERAEVSSREPEDLARSHVPLHLRECALHRDAPVVREFFSGPLSEHGSEKRITLQGGGGVEVPNTRAGCGYG